MSKEEVLLEAVLENFSNILKILNSTKDIENFLVKAKLKKNKKQGIGVILEKTKTLVDSLYNHSIKVKDEFYKNYNMLGSTEEENATEESIRESPVPTPDTNDTTSENTLAEHNSHNLDNISVENEITNRSPASPKNSSAEITGTNHITNNENDIADDTADITEEKELESNSVDSPKNGSEETTDTTNATNENNILDDSPNMEEINLESASVGNKTTNIDISDCRESNTEDGETTIDTNDLHQSIEDDPLRDAEVSDTDQLYNDKNVNSQKDSSIEAGNKDGENREETRESKSLIRLVDLSKLIDPKPKKSVKFDSSVIILTSSDEEVKSPKKSSDRKDQTHILKSMLKDSKCHKNKDAKENYSTESHKNYKKSNLDGSKEISSDENKSKSKKSSNDESSPDNSRRSRRISTKIDIKEKNRQKLKTIFKRKSSRSGQSNFEIISDKAKYKHESDSDSASDSTKKRRKSHRKQHILDKILVLSSSTEDEVADVEIKKNLKKKKNKSKSDVSSSVRPSVDDIKLTYKVYIPLPRFECSKLQEIYLTNKEVLEIKRLTNIESLSKSKRSRSTKNESSLSSDDTEKPKKKRSKSGSSSNRKGKSKDSSCSDMEHTSADENHEKLTEETETVEKTSFEKVTDPDQEMANIVMDELKKSVDADKPGDDTPDSEAEEESKSKKNKNDKLKKSVDADKPAGSSDSEEGESTSKKNKKDKLKKSVDADKPAGSSDSEKEEESTPKKNKKDELKKSVDADQPAGSSDSEEGETTSKKNKKDQLKKSVDADKPAGSSDSEEGESTSKKNKKDELKKSVDADKPANESSDSGEKEESATKKNKKKESDDSEDEDAKRKKKWRKDKLLTLNVDSSDSEEEFNKYRKRKEKSKEESRKTRKRAKVISDSDDSDAGKKTSRGSSSDGDSSDEKKSTSSDESEEKEKPKKKSTRSRIKRTKDSSDDDDKSTRKQIRRVIGKDSLSDSTKQAEAEEKERKARIAEKQKKYNNIFEAKADSTVSKLVLDYDEKSKEELLSVHKKIVKKLKPHQASGVQFMWDACFESLERAKSAKGSGCILAHCMGLGKTLQVIALCHCLLTNTEVGVNKIMVVCPINTVLNWKAEFKLWLPKGHNIEVYELVSCKQNYERQYTVQEWHNEGGVLIIGYHMFRNLSNPSNKRLSKKLRETFKQGLVDPGPDLVVCDEGHLLKNEKTHLSIAMNRIQTARRIVLTGTPLQNNLKEYWCMVQFIKPNLLGTYKEYLNRFVNPIINGQYTDSTQHDIILMRKRSHVLHKLLDGVVQRRDYAVLEPYLPPKHEYVLFVQLTDVQVKLYEYYMAKFARQTDDSNRTSFLFTDFQQLQRICTHPRVLLEKSKEKAEKFDDEDSEGSLRDFIDDGGESDGSSKSSSSKSSDDSSGKTSKSKSRVRVTRAQAALRRDNNEDSESELEEVQKEWWQEFCDGEELDNINNSGKLFLLFQILKECEEIGDKVLVFSQSLYTLNCIEYFLEKIDEATQNENTEKVGGHKGSWAIGLDYFRLDGSSSCDNRATWCDLFNNPDNTRARLFLISTRAGGLGINLVAANRVIIFDVSWNPSHDIQSIYRVYRFGQTKPCYIYRFVTYGAMEMKIYERQVTKQAISKRVIDEQQIDRHYNQNDLQELYRCDLHPTDRPIPMVPKDVLLGEMLQKYDKTIYKYHLHQSLLENKEAEGLNEAERKAAWEEFENEKVLRKTNVTSNNSIMNAQAIELALTNIVRKDNPTWSDVQVKGIIPALVQQLRVQLSEGDMKMYTRVQQEMQIMQAQAQKIKEAYFQQQVMRMIQHQQEQAKLLGNMNIDPAQLARSQVNMFGNLLGPRQGTSGSQPRRPMSNDVIELND